MDLGLKGKVCWVNGASSGLGFASAMSLAREGAVIALSSRGGDKLTTAAAEIAEQTGAKVVAVPADVSELSSISNAHDHIRAELGPVDVLVANGGGPPHGGFDDFDDQQLFDAFSLTTASAWRLAKAVVPDMRSTGGGVIEFITSSSTKEVIGGLLLSNMMRAAVVGMAKTLSKELAADGIRVVCLTPGRIETDRVLQLDEARAKATGVDLKDVRSTSERAIPLGRYGSIGEFGDVVAFVASERATYITGTSVVVDGGMLNGILS